MLQRTEKGKEARRYFIECERRLRETKPLEVSFVEQVLPYIPPGRAFTVTQTKTGSVTVRVKESPVAAASPIARNPKPNAKASRFSNKGRFGNGPSARIDGLYAPVFGRICEILAEHSSQWLDKNVVAKQAGLSVARNNRMQIYRILNTLIDNGLIERSGKHIRLIPKALNDVRAETQK